MNKVLIIAHAMNLGGVETSLLGLLENIDKKKYQIDLFLLRHEGELLTYIPPEVNLLPETDGYKELAKPIKDVLKQKHFKIAAARLYGKIEAYIYRKQRKMSGDDGVAIEYSHKFTYKILPFIESQYDVVISYLTPHYIGAFNVAAKKRIAWIHTDYSKIDIDRKSELKMWSQYNWIVSISKDVTISFINSFPELADRIIEIENILPVNYISERLKEQNAHCSAVNRIKFLSIGRYCYQKNFDSIPFICSDLVRQGVDLIWYIIGYGPDEQLIKDMITKYHMEEHVVLLGKTDNPYPYIKSTDYYLQLSRYEGKSVAVREAQYFHKPVIISNYPTAAAQLTDGVDGFIIPQNIELAGQNIKKILDNTRSVENVIRNCMIKDFTNIKAVEKIYKIID